MAQADYLNQNSSYWSQGVYDAPNPETYVYRAYSRVFKFDFGLDGSGHEKLLDFGCGPGGNTKFYHDKGFDVYGVDLSGIDIARCKERIGRASPIDASASIIEKMAHAGGDIVNGYDSDYDLPWNVAVEVYKAMEAARIGQPDISDHFKVVSPEARRDDRWFGDTKFKIVTAFQSLYYYNNTDLEARLQSLYAMMEPGAIIYATMMAESCWYYGMSEPAQDGMRLVKLRRSTDKGRAGLTVNDHYINFTKDADDLRRKFHMFKPKHSTGYYDSVYRDDQGSEKHLIFIGQK